jgi:hypothetical protein
VVVDVDERWTLFVVGYELRLKLGLTSGAQAPDRDARREKTLEPRRDAHTTDNWRDGGGERGIQMMENSVAGNGRTNN